MNATKLASFAALAVGFICLGAGCDKLTRQRFDLIDVGHAERYDVKMTIGDDRDPEVGNMWHYERVDKHLNVMIHFDDGGKVWRKEWHDTGNGDHYDSSPPGGDSSTYESNRVRTIDQ